MTLNQISSAVVTAAPSISSAALFVELSISTWTGRKLDKRATADTLSNNAAASGAGSFHKKLLGDCAELDAVHKFVGNARTFHYASTMAWSDMGMRLVPTAHYAEYHKEITGLEQQFHQLVEQFLTAYQWAQTEAQVKLGALYNPPEYPDVDTENGIESKSDDLLKKLRSNCNIGATHSLYLSMTEEHLREIESRNYHVVIDEELGVIDSFDHYSIDDLSYLLDKGDIEISATDGMISWVGKDVGTKNKYKYFSTLCNSKSVYATKRNDTMMVTQLPIKLFTCAKRVIIMTYMFDGNILDCFLKLKGVKTKPFTEVETTKVSKAKLRELITLVPPTNEVSKVGMSSSKYSKGSKEDCLVVSNYIRNVCRQYDALSKDVMYTFPKVLLDSNRKNGKKIRPKSFIEYKLPVLDDIEDIGTTDMNTRVINMGMFCMKER